MSSQGQGLLGIPTGLLMIVGGLALQGCGCDALCAMVFGATWLLRRRDDHGVTQSCSGQRTLGLLMSTRDNLWSRGAWCSLAV